MQWFPAICHAGPSSLVFFERCWILSDDDFQTVLFGGLKRQMSKACIDRSDSLIFQHKRRPRVIGFTYASSEVPFRSTESQTFYRSMMTADQMSVRELRHDKPSGWFSKSRGLSASVSFHFSPPPIRSFTCAIFRAVFDSRSSLFAPKPHGNACYAG